jgi:signal transduction histidine kinase
LNIASHELKTPLTAISAYLEILDDYKGQFNKDQLQGLDAIKRNSNQLKMLIGNILEISRLDSGRFDLNITEINVKEKIILLVENLKILSDNKHIELKSDCDGVEKINTDAMRFEEILNNLVGNAIKFTDKGSITVKAEFGKGKEKGFVVFSVTDTGVGIPEDKMNNLFQKFYQVDATVSRRYGGTGLGLSITKKMIELQGGEITVSSIVGKGTTFRFTLPIQPLKKIPDTTKSLNGSKAKTTVSTTSEVKADANTDVDTAIAKTAGMKNDITVENKPDKTYHTKHNIKYNAKIKSVSQKSSNSKQISKQINRHTSKKKK